MAEASAITRLLREASAGREGALAELWPLVHAEIKTLARALMRGERPGHTLGATGLVHEAWLRIAAQESLGCEHRAQFFAAAGTAMRRVLVDHARRARRLKRGAGERPSPLDEAVAVLESRSGDLLALDCALESLAAVDLRKARLVELRFYAGLDMHQSAEALSISLRQAEREWTLARAFLRQRLDAAPVWKLL